MANSPQPELSYYKMSANITKHDKLKILTSVNGYGAIFVILSPFIKLFNNRADRLLQLKIIC